jgi:hypothetical protein
MRATAKFPLSLFIRKRNMICFWVCVYHHQKHIRRSVVEVNTVIQKTATLWYTHRVRMDWNASTSPHSRMLYPFSLSHIAKTAVLFCDKHNSFFATNTYIYMNSTRRAASANFVCVALASHNDKSLMWALSETRAGSAFESLWCWMWRCVHRA